MEASTRRQRYTERVMGARNMRLLRVSRSVAILCWAVLWAVLLSVQLHPRQPVGQCDAKRAEAGQLIPGWGALLNLRVYPSPRALQKSPLLTQEQAETGVGRCETCG